MISKDQQTLSDQLRAENIPPKLLTGQKSTKKSLVIAIFMSNTVLKLDSKSQEGHLNMQQVISATRGLSLKKLKKQRT